MHIYQTINSYFWREPWVWRQRRMWNFHFLIFAWISFLFWIEHVLTYWLYNLIKDEKRTLKPFQTCLLTSWEFRRSPDSCSLSFHWALTINRQPIYYIISKFLNNPGRWALFFLFLKWGHRGSEWISSFPSVAQINGKARVWTWWGGAWCTTLKPMYPFG